MLQITDTGIPQVNAGNKGAEKAFIVAIPWNKGNSITERKKGGL
jgi:hypothetical protein